MKTIQISALTFIVMIGIASCSESNFTPSIDASNSGMKADATDPANASKWIKPENFVSGITNQYSPLTPGDSFFYTNVIVENGDTSTEDIVVAVSEDTKIIQGITCEIVHDYVTVNDTISEDTYDWYAQDVKGNIWYFGEDTKAYNADGSYSTEGSFESGVDGAVAGIVMPGDPQAFLGHIYRQEYLAGEAQDKAKVVSTNATVAIGYGTFTHCVRTQETSPLEPGTVENKWYAPGVGQILTTLNIGGNEREELIGKNF
jgi:hypothetical protein